MARNLQPEPAWMPETIMEQLGPVTFVAHVQNGQMWKCHTDHIKALEDQSWQSKIATESEGSKGLGGESEIVDIPLPNTE